MSTSNEKNPLVDDVMDPNYTEEGDPGVKADTKDDLESETDSFYNPFTICIEKMTVNIYTDVLK